MPIAEMRKFERFSLNLETQLFYTTEQRTQKISLTTKDVSCGGAYFHTSSPLPKGTDCYLELYLSLPCQSDSPKKISRLTSYGSVVRQDEYGMAIEFHSNCKLLPLDKTDHSPKKPIVH